MSDLNVDVDVDITKGEESIEILKAQIASVGNANVKVVNAVQTTVKQTKQSFLKVLSQVQQAVGVVDALMRTLGVTMSMSQRLIIRSVFSTIRVVGSLYTAIAAGDPTGIMKVQALIGLAGLGVAAGAATAAEMQATQMSTQLAAGFESLSMINMMIGNMSFI